jgi:hypothetical protein
MLLQRWSSSRRARLVTPPNRRSADDLARVWATATGQPATPSYRLLRVKFQVISRRTAGVFFPALLVGEPIIWDLWRQV